jgi:ribosomal protein L15E
MNSYYVWEDGTHHWFETILCDPALGKLH